MAPSPGRCSSPIWTYAAFACKLHARETRSSRRNRLGTHPPRGIAARAEAFHAKRRRLNGSATGNFPCSARNRDSLGYLKGDTQTRCTRAKSDNRNRASFATGPVQRLPRLWIRKLGVKSLSPSCSRWSLRYPLSGLSSHQGAVGPMGPLVHVRLNTFLVRPRAVCLGTST